MVILMASSGGHVVIVHFTQEPMYTKGEAIILFILIDIESYTFTNVCHTSGQRWTAQVA